MSTAILSYPGVYRSRYLISPMRIIGHRGASHVAPENTLAAVRLALDAGVAFEIDLQLLRDGTLIVLHDDTLERTANVDYALTHRKLVREPVARLRWVDVAGVDVGSWFGPIWASERVPRFQDVLADLRTYDEPGGGAHCFAELKGERPHDPRLPELAAAAIEEARVPPTALSWISFSLPILLEMKKLCPQHQALYVTACPTVEAAWRAARAAAAAGLDGVDFRADASVVSAELVEWLHERRMRVVVWMGQAPCATDNEENWRALEANGVDDLTSNLPPSLWDWRERTSQQADMQLAKSAVKGVAATFATALVATRSWGASEDITDLCHSLVGTACSARAFVSSFRAPPPPQLDWYEDRSGAEARRLLAAPVLPCADDAMARRFVLCSTSYSAVDTAHIFLSLLFGRKPCQWRSRLAFHVLQVVANLPALYATPPAAAVVRRYLLLANLAKASTVLLRLRGLAKRGDVGGEAVQCALAQGQLAAFALTRLLNLPYITNNVWRARDSLPRALWRLHLVFAASATLLSGGWFAKLLGLGKAGRPRALKSS